MEEICQALITKAKKGDVRAFETIRNTIDPTWKNESLFQNENWSITFGIDDFGDL